jgi:hypothetical protein
MPKNVALNDSNGSNNRETLETIETMKIVRNNVKEVTIICF